MIDVKLRGCGSVPGSLRAHCLRQQDRQRRHEHLPPILEYGVPHRQRPHDPDANLSRFLLKIHQWVAELRINQQSWMELIRSCDKLLPVAAIRGFLSQGE